MRLIDVNELEQHCRNTKIIELFPEWKDFSYEMKIALIRYGKAWKEIIQNAPTVDAVEVVHGRWEPRKDAIGFVRCSVCRDCNIYDDWADGKKWNYCPNCGAKMDGDGNG